MQIHFGAIKRSLFLLLTILFVDNALGQSKPAAAGGSSTSITPQQGFVYYLKYQKHLQYSATHTDSFYFSYRQLHNTLGVDNIFHRPVRDGVLMTTSFFFDRKVVKIPSSDPINLTDYNMRPFDLLTDVQVVNIDPTKLRSMECESDTVLIIRIQYCDSLPRYWAVDRRSLFTKSRLRISLTQDSAILLAAIKYNEFEQQGDTNTFAVTNPNFKGKEPNTQAQQFFAAGPQLPVLFYDNTLLGPALQDYKAAKDQGNIVRQKDIFDNRIKGVYQDHFSPRYTEDRKKLETLQKTKGFKHPDTKLQQDIATSEYQIIRQRYMEVEDIYHDLSRERKKQLNNQLTDLENADKDARPALAIAYVESLLAFQNEFPRPQPPLAINTADARIPETAISISGTDSAANFYFKIIHKSLVRQSIFFLPYHYGAYDYGTLTVPFRYRFAPKNKLIFTQSGKDSFATAPSASDAAISLAVYFGRKWGRTRFYENSSQSHNTFSFEPVVITGPTLIPMSISNVDSNSRYVSAKTAYVYIGPNNIISWSVGLGAVLEWKTINIGVFAGKDFPLVANTGWIYARKTWIGFGIGVNLGMLSSGNAVN
jgi:hypothetical protein